jgi:hypothetical protein
MRYWNFTITRIKIVERTVVDTFEFITASENSPDTELALDWLGLEGLPEFSFVPSEPAFIDHIADGVLPETPDFVAGETKFWRVPMWRKKRDPFIHNTQPQWCPSLTFHYHRRTTLSFFKDTVQRRS